MAKRKTRISDQMRRLIEQSEHSRYAIHKATGIDQAVLCHFLQGSRGLSLDTIDTLGEFLGWELIERKR